jgi:hypothetical protein
VEPAKSHSCNRVKSSQSSVANLYSSNVRAMSALMCRAAVLAGQYPDVSSPLTVRQGNTAPRSPKVSARRRTRGSVAARQRRASAAALGAVSVSMGTTKPSMSQKVCPL